MLFSAGRDITLTLSGDYNLAAGSGVIAGGDALVSASSVNNAGAMMVGGTLTVRTPGAISNTGLLDGTGGLSLALDGALSNVQGAILSDAGRIEIGGLSRSYAGAVLNRSGEIMAGSAAGDVVIRAASLTNDILGGVTTTSNQVVYDKKYTVGSDALAAPPALNPSLTNYGAINQYYNHVMKIYVPELWYSPTGQKGTGYYIVALDGASASSFVEVTGTGSSATADNAAALISAGRNLVVETTGDILNDASHIAAGQDMALTGASLTNKGYDTEIVWSLTENSPHLKRWFTPSDGSQFVTPDPAASSNSAGNPGWMNLNGGPHTTQWGSSTYTGLSGSIVAGGNLTGSFTGQLNNTTVVAHATPDLLASANAYSGTTPGSVSPAGSVAAASGGGLAIPDNAGSFAQASTATSSGTTGAGAVSGGQLASQTGTTATGQASAVSGGTLDGISPGSTQAVSTQAGGGTTTSVPAGSSVAAPVYGNVLPPEGHESGATTAQNLALPGFTGAAAASVSQVISSVPAGKALYVPNPTPDAHVLIETNPAYTSLTAFHGSEYLLDRLGDQPQDYTFLGDSTFDQQYVQQQIVSATGQTFLGGTYNTASSQMQALLDNAVSESNQLGLSLGQGLSSAQQAALTSDIVWYQNEEVDGQTVLVPKLYLAPGHEALTGASISGKNVSLTAASVTNSGSVSAQDALSITATSGDITNTGSLSGGTVSLTAQDGSILNSDTINTYLVQGGTRGQLASVGTITATGAASLSAAKDITFNGGVLTTGSDLSVLAGDGLTLGTTTVQQAAAVSGKSLSMSGSQTQNYGTTVTAGGNATLAALGGDLKAAGATLTSEGATTLLAGKSLDLGAVTNSESESISGSKSGFLTHSSFSNSQSSSTDVGTTVAAGTDLTAVSGGDMHVAGMVGGGGDVSLQSGGAFTESALHSASSEASSHHVAGLHMSTQGASGTVGYGSRTDAQSVSSSTYTPSVVASTGGSLNIGAKGPVKIDGSVVAAAKDLGISGSSVAFTTEQNSMTQTAMHKDKSIGVTGGISPDSMVGQAINGALGAKSSGTGVQSALAGIQTGLGEGMSAIGGATTNNIIGGQVSVGFSSNKSRSGETRTTVQGSTASAGGTLAIEARGDNTTDKNNGDLSATAAHLSGQDVALAAQNGITLNSGVNTDHTEATSSSKSASVGVEASVGTTGNVGVSVTASASASHQHSESDSTTHVDTTVSATHAVTLNTPGTTTLDGAEVNGERVNVKSGMLVITSPQDTASYNSSSESGGFSVSIPVYGAGSFGASANVAGQTIKDTYRSTEATQSGLYAGNGGLDVDVAGNTTLKAGAISSTADASLNHFHTQSLDVRGEDNQSTWSGTSVAAGGGFSTAGSLADAAKTVTVAVGHVDHTETTTTNSVITGNIGVESGSSTGSYSTDLTAANGHLENDFNASKVNNTLSTQTAAETAAETAVEVGIQAYDKWGAKSEQGGVSGQKASTTIDASKRGSNTSQDADTSNTTEQRAVGSIMSSAVTGQGENSLNYHVAQPIDDPSVGGPSGSVATNGQRAWRTLHANGDETITVASHRVSKGVDFSQGMTAAEFAQYAWPPLATGMSTIKTVEDLQSGDYKQAGKEFATGILPSLIPEGKIIGVITGLKELQAAAKVGEKVSQTEGAVNDSLHMMEGSAGTATKRVGPSVTEAGRQIEFDGQFYSADGFKFSASYYDRLWSSGGRPAPFLQARAIMDSNPTIMPDPRGTAGYFRYEGAGMEMIYNPTTGQVGHIQPLR
ncbi:hemagglutinin repeat-containing protein [Acetobacter senegalensis]|nr:hemagglutinin repeat-containing protein [Acetobacter senegalensis]MCP1195071.1 hemagglutinin repeat-containing protein [Acetobacter senegalensis]